MFASIAHRASSSCRANQTSGNCFKYRTASPLIKKRYEDLLVEPVASTPEALAQFLDEQLAFNKDIIEKAKIRVQ
jgi:tripartite-type tricarboxylate transporter receptor subunit TctC